MEEFFRFVQQSGRERSRPIDEACAIRDSVVRSTPASEQTKRPPMGRAINPLKADHNNGGRS
jgi:hypothetical protein